MKLELEGKTLYAYTGGRAFDPALPWVVFLHGAQHDHSVWILQSRYFAHHGCSVLAFDAPGHGRSDGSPAPSVEQLADRLAAAIQTLGPRQLVLVGHSMGALVALELALRLGDAVRALVLVGAAFPMRVSDALLAATRDDPEDAMQMINVWSHSASIAPFAARPGNPGPGFNIVWENLRLMQRIARAHGPEVLVNDFAACNAYAGGLEAARALNCPVHFVVGERDQMTPPKAVRPLIEACIDATVTQVPGVGHALMAEAPDAVRIALAQTLARTGWSPAG